MSSGEGEFPPVGSATGSIRSEVVTFTGRALVGRVLPESRGWVPLSLPAGRGRPQLKRLRASPRRRVIR